MAYVKPRRRSYTRNSTYSDATWKTPTGSNPMGKGAVLFTGPDGIGDYKVNVVTDDRFVGIGTMSAEGTSELKYIMRASPKTPHPRPKTSWVGEIGWLIPPYKDYRAVSSRQQIKNGEFRRANENRHTHLYQNPWYPGPNDAEYSSMYRFTGHNFIRTEKKPKPSQFPAASTGMISSAYAAAKTVSIPVPREQAILSSYCSRNHDGQMPSMYSSQRWFTNHSENRRGSQTSFSEHNSHDQISQNGSFPQSGRSKHSSNNNNSVQQKSSMKVRRVPEATPVQY
ncbi:uncharacterized protein [Antedon mediterranea]|uniref:uncharacterized protein n=1 Tax=Antedon mediterranea TaxID=105859 RepID=UPI003AF885B8